MGTKASKNEDGDDDPSDEVGFNDFEVLRSIGKGSFGKVCIVRRKKTENEVYAMKYMNKLSSWKHGAVDHVLRELEILSTLRHQFLVNLWFTFQDEEDIFMVSDLLMGGDLRYHIQRRVHFTFDDVRIYFCELALVLDYLRNKHIIHRDIKPDNILLDERGHLHLTDFNIATVLNDEHPCAKSFAGTKPYAAPEIYNSTSGYDYAVDWWSLGVTMYEVLRHKRPFNIGSDTTNEEVTALHNDGSISFPVDWGQPIMNLFFKLFKVDPTKRIQSFESLISEEFCQNVEADDVIGLKDQPTFQPSQKELNYDPTFELEEMIIESNPLHKKKQRIQKLKKNSQKKKSLKRESCSEQEEKEEEWERVMEEIGSKFEPFNRRKLELAKSLNDTAQNIAQSSDESVILNNDSAIPHDDSSNIEAKVETS